MRAHRLIRRGEEILFNYGSSLPFMQHSIEEMPEGGAEEEEEH